MTDMTDKQEPEYWQWRRKCERWGIDRIYRHEVFATTDDSEVRQLFATPPANPAEPVQPQWLPIETAPKGGCLIDILLPDGKRWAGCHYDAICDQWRNIGPSGHMVTVQADYATHWMPLPAAPKGTT